MYKIIIPYLIMLSIIGYCLACMYPIYTGKHFGHHDFDLMVDSFYYQGRKYEVRVCTKDQCGKLDTFPHFTTSN